VTNHLSSEKLREKMGTKLFRLAGFTEVLLGGPLIKATRPSIRPFAHARRPPRSISMAAAMRCLQAHDGEGRTFMQLRGVARRLPRRAAKFLIAEMARLYPRLKASRSRSAGGMRMKFHSQARKLRCSRTLALSHRPGHKLPARAGRWEFSSLATFRAVRIDKTEAGPDREAR